MEQGETRIRDARPEDATVLAGIGARSFEEAFGADNSAEDMAAYLTKTYGPAQQAAELANTANIFLIAEIQGHAVGYIKLHAGTPPPDVRGPTPLELARIYVLQANTGQGLGTKLMQACLDLATQRGYETLWLGVWEHNTRAISFYRRWGFEQVGTHSFLLGSDLQTDLLMQRPVHKS